MTQFESKFKGKIQIVDISLDKENDPNIKKYDSQLKEVAAIPHTVWLDKTGKSIQVHVGYATAAELEQKTNALLK